jgi:hypothetical protein
MGWRNLYKALRASDDDIDSRDPLLVQNSFCAHTIPTVQAYLIERGRYGELQG